MTKAIDFTRGPVYSPLVRFAVPILGALFLQALYGGIDLLIVGQFSSTADVSGVATGSMIMHTLTMVIIGLSMGITILTAQKIGEGDHDNAGLTVGNGISLFLVIGLVWTIVMILFSEGIAALMHSPAEAFGQTVDYVKICGGGALFITAYNIIGSIFRGMGDSKMPLITVCISAAFNVIGDMIFVCLFKMGAAGAAWATVISQALSVLVSMFIIRRRKLPFTVRRSDLKIRFGTARDILKLGCPLALQDLLVGLSFLVIMGIGNSLGVEKSAGIGVAERVCGFIMLFPAAFSQSVSTFVAQNFGAGNLPRANRGLFYGIATSLCVGFVIGSIGFFKGDLLSSIFSRDAAVIMQSHDYLKAYAIDTLFTSFMFCFAGYFNGVGKTFFTMIQGIVGAFCVRIPVSILVVRLVDDCSLFQLGLATPASTIVQIILCVIAFVLFYRKNKVAAAA